MFITLMLRFHIKLSKKKNLLTVFPHAILFLNVNKNVPILKQIVTDDEKWILHNNMEQKRSWGKQNEPPLTSPKAGGGVHTAGLRVLYYELLLENQMINSVMLPITPTESSTPRKAARNSQQKTHNLPSGYTRMHVSLMTRQ